MEITTKQNTLITPVLVINLMIFCHTVSAGEAGKSNTLTDRLSEEVYQAISELMKMASSIKGDKLDKEDFAHVTVKGQVSPFNSRGLNGNEMALHANNLRYGAKQNTWPYSKSNFSHFSELASFQNKIFGEQTSSRLGTYVRMDSSLYTNNYDKAYFSNEVNQEKDGYSVTLGGDYLFNDHYLFGVALGLPFNEEENQHKVNEIDGLVASGYFSYFRDDWFIDFTASYAVMDTDIERRIRHYSDSVYNDANDADSDIWVFSLGGGYVVEYDYLNIALESSIQHTLSDTDRYAERPSKGNSNYLISKVDNINNLESTMVIAGMSISHPFRADIGIFQPYVRGYVHYDIDSGSERIISQLKADNSGSILPIIVDTDDHVYGRVHLGISGAFNRNWNGYAEASTLVGLDELSAYTFTLGVSIPLD